MTESVQELKQLLRDLLTRKLGAKGLQDGIGELEGRFMKLGFEQTQGIFEHMHRNMSMVQDEFLALYCVLNGIVDELEKEKKDE